MYLKTTAVAAQNQTNKLVYLKLKYMLMLLKKQKQNQ
jgi:hypothetical protein